MYFENCKCSRIFFSDLSCCFGFQEQKTKTLCSSKFFQKQPNLPNVQKTWGPRDSLLIPFSNTYSLQNDKAGSNFEEFTYIFGIRFHHCIVQ